MCEKYEGCGNCAKRVGCVVDNIYKCFAYVKDENVDEDEKTNTGG